jgi:hypothetical protein
VSLDYTVDLTSLAGMRIIAATASYDRGSFGNPTSLTDDGGSTTNMTRPVVINWGPQGIALLNAHIGQECPVHAVLTYTGSEGFQPRLLVSSFVITYQGGVGWNRWMG